MKEEIVSFETAKLAKSRGFNENVLYHYGSGYTPCVNDDGLFMDDVCNSEIDPYEFSAPTQSLLQRWLREVHNVVIVVRPVDERISDSGDWKNRGYGVIFYKYSEDSIIIDHAHIPSDLSGYLDYFPTYEQALEVGLQESLKLIEE